MSVWHNNLQAASYKGVAFEVAAIDDRNEKTLVEHARPFVNGVDLEDMGTQGRSVQMAALYFGRGFDSKLTSLLTVLEEQGAGVLVHPLFGRMQNMIAASWSVRTEADMVNYTALDITFREATESQPIFVFENAFLARLEKLLNLIDGYRNKVLDFIDAVLAVKNGISEIWGSALGLWAALSGVVAAVRRLFDLDGGRYPGAGVYSAAAFTQAGRIQAATLAEMIDAGLAAEAANGANGGLNVRQRFDAVVVRLDVLAALPADLLSGKGETAGNSHRRIHKITPLQMQPVAQLVRLLAVGRLVRLAAEMIEAESDTLTAPDLQHINAVVRIQVQGVINALRSTEAQALAKNSTTAAAIYTRSHTLAEALREAAAQFNALVAAAINQKPPLIVRRAEIDGTIHQFAHAFYADIRRAEELMRLNPHLTHPAFIRRGNWINGYAK
jgi:prophage DNA circulation protein